jgi:hypothetical protein
MSVGFPVATAAARRPPPHLTEGNTMSSSEIPLTVERAVSRAFKLGRGEEFLCLSL